MGLNHWEWEGVRLKKKFPHISKVKVMGVSKNLLMCYVMGCKFALSNKIDVWYSGTSS